MMVANNAQYVKNYLKDIKNIEIYKQGQKTILNKDSKEFDKAIKKILKIALRGRIMPALGVSLHDDTVNALKTDSFLKINFNKEFTINDLPFTALLFRLEDNCYGINLIREYNNRYDGRCIYLAFDEPVNLKEIVK